MALEPKERIIIPENGEEHLFEVLVTFAIDKLKQSYVAVTPVEQNEDEDEEVEVFAFRYEMKEDDDNDLALFAIESDEEWDLVEEMLHTLVDEEMI